MSRTFSFQYSKCFVRYSLLFVSISVVVPRDFVVTKYISISTSLSAKYTLILVVRKEVFHKTEGVLIYDKQENLIAKLCGKSELTFFFIEYIIC